MRHGVLPFAIALAVAVAPGCKASPPTALVLALRTDTMPPEVSSLVVTVTRDGATRFTQTYALPSGAALPGTLTLSNGRDEDPGDSITVVVLGKGTKTVTRTARLGFVREKTKLLRLAVERACIDVPCVDGETCAGGTCVPIDVDPSTLPDFTSNGDAVTPEAGDRGGSAGAGGAGGALLGGTSGGTKGGTTSSGGAGSGGTGGTGGTGGPGGSPGGTGGSGGNSGGVGGAFGGSTSGSGGTPGGGASGNTATAGKAGAGGPGQGGTGGIGGASGIAGKGASAGTGGIAGAGVSGSGGNSGPGGAGAGNRGNGGAAGNSGAGGAAGTGVGPCSGTGGPTMVQIATPGGGMVCIDSTEVTIAQYQAFRAATGDVVFGANPACTDFGKASYAPDATCMASLACSDVVACGDRPMPCVDFCDALDFCAWSGKHLCGTLDGKTADDTLWSDPTASAWMNACSSSGLHAYPYGDAYDATACNTWDNPTTGCNAGTCVSTAAGSLATCQASGSYAGVFDLSGNLFEWSDSVIGSGAIGYKARTRGASFTTFSQDDRCDMSDHTPVSGAYDNVGFRCCSP